MQDVALIALSLLAFPGFVRQTPPISATVPLDVSTNCTIVQLGFAKQDGSIRSARFVVDTGGGAFLLAEPLANEIGARRAGEVVKSEEGAFAPIEAPAVQLGDMPIDLTGVRAAEMLSADHGVRLREVVGG